MTLRLDHVMRLPPAEREAAFQRADAACAAEAVKIGVTLRKHRPDYECTIHEYCKWNEQDWACIVGVRHDHPSMLSMRVSLNGDASKAASLPNKCISVRPQSSGRFMLIVAQKWLRLEKDKKHLFGCNGDLVGDEWTASEREEWKQLRETADAINQEIRYRPRRVFAKRRYTPMPFGYTA